MKPFYTKHGKFVDGRDRIIIKDKENNSTLALPKPEILWKMLIKSRYPKKR